jgi:hypothetical protein
LHQFPNISAVSTKSNPKSMGTEPTWKLYATFDNIGGLKASSPVKIGGVVKSATRSARNSAASNAMIMKMPTQISLFLLCIASICNAKQKKRNLGWHFHDHGVTGCTVSCAARRRFKVDANHHAANFYRRTGFQAANIVKGRVELPRRLGAHRKSEIWVGIFMIMALLAALFLALRVADLKSMGTEPKSNPSTASDACTTVRVVARLIPSEVGIAS